ncbi:hypothetical protein GW17_00011293 [Ensete ventricosum]|nr:hypothetical protein GW17_00011293 [Ensete ventricosum]
MSNALVNGLAGAGGGIIAQIITYPLQTVNTRQQTERIAKKTSLAAAASGGDLSSSGAAQSSAGGTIYQILQVSSSLLPSPRRTYSSSADSVSFLLTVGLQLFKMEGWGGLYSGLKPSLMGTAASQGIYYYFYQVLKNEAEAAAAARKKKGLGDGTVGMFSWLVVAAIAGSLNVLLTNPIWVLVTRMQACTHTQAERKIMEARKEAILREYAGTTYMEHELVKLDLMKPRPYGTFHAVSFLAGGIGKIGGNCGNISFISCKGILNSFVFLISESNVSRLQAKQEIGRNAMSRYTGTTFNC